MKSKLLCVFSSIVLLYLFAPAAFATPVALDNSSFELSSGQNYDGSLGPWTMGDIQGWSHSGATSEFGIWAPAFGYIDSVPDGKYIGWLQEGYIEQTIGELVEAGDTYNLSVDIGNRADKSFPSYSVELLAGSTVLASSGSVLPNEGQFQTLTLGYLVSDSDANIGSQLGIRISYYGDGAQLNFDNVKFDNQDRPPQSVPEPGSMILLGLGLAALAGYGRKKFK